MAADCGVGGTKRSLPQDDRECAFGVKCQNLLTSHFQEFGHKHLTLALARWKEGATVSPSCPKTQGDLARFLDQLRIVAKLACKAAGPKDAPRSNTDIQAKLKAAAPYNLFLTSISDSPQTHSEPLTITFTELLDRSLGELESSLQINFIVDLRWLLAQYFHSENRSKPLTLLYGVEDGGLTLEGNLPSNVTAVKVSLPSIYGHHHTKMSVLSYKDHSIRVIVSTANLVESDWENRTQGLWISPKLPQLPPDANSSLGDSSTQFKADLIRYLRAYDLPELQEWLGKIQKADFSSVRVFLVASVPGTHCRPDSTLWGHHRVRQLLTEHVSDPKISQSPWNKWPVIGQFSSIGSLGPYPNSWLCGELKSSFSAPSKPMDHPSIKLIYPSLSNVKESHDGLLGGACLNYMKKIHDKQEWLASYLHQWHSDSRHRSCAMPHIKSYLRVSPCHSFLSWFLLTSANLSKVAWGTETRMPGPGLQIRSYEAGVLFLPKFMVDDHVFILESGKSASATSSVGTEKKKNCPLFPLHFDLPVDEYGAGDSPFFYDSAFSHL